VDLLANVHRDFVAYVDLLAPKTGQPISDPANLVARMLAWLMAARSQYSTGRQEFAAANRTAADSGFGSFSAGGRRQVEKAIQGMKPKPVANMRTFNG